MIVFLKIHASGKIFDKICLKTIIDAFSSNMWSVIWEQGDSIFWWRWHIQQKGKVQTFWLAGRPPKFFPLAGHPPALRRVLDLLTVMILKRVKESTFFQINKFTACKFKDKKEMENSLMAFNLLTFIHLFQGKKHLRTKWNLNCKSQEYLISH